MTEEAVLTVPDARAIRGELLDLIHADLHGPLGGPDEEFPIRENPTDRYPLGRLAPRGIVVEPETQDELGEAQDADPTEDQPEQSAPNIPSLHPSALGFTATVTGDVDQLTVVAKWACYERGKSEQEERAGSTMWQRQQFGGSGTIRMTDGLLTPMVPDRQQPDVVVRGRARRHEGNWLVSLFLENQQHAAGQSRNAQTPAWMFQVSLSAAGPDGTFVFLARPDRPSGGDAADQDEQRRLAMAYRHHPEFAVGSGTAVHVAAEDIDHDFGRARRISTSTVPRYEIPATDVPSAADDPDLAELADLELGMKRLAELAEDPEALRDRLDPLVTEYRAWIERQARRIEDPAERLADYGDAAHGALEAARRAADRIAAGIRTLATDPIARRAFGFANHAMHLQRLHTLVAARRRAEPSLGLEDTVATFEEDDDAPRWRPFQLAFILLNLASLAEPRHPERADDREQAVADLLWFPTGGGKTEAYLGLTAFTIAVRRLQPRYGGLDGGDGVAVLMRYTLRLLTIQQFERAATLVCAAEVLRRQDPATWGARPVRIGLWVGGRVTPNTTEHAEDWVKQVRRGRTARGAGSPHQLSGCPWCGTEIEKGRDIGVDRTYRRTLITCADTTCPFGSLAAQDEPDAERRGLPVLVVDEEIYRHPPSLLIGTVDKFAQLPWRGETTTLFGRVNRRCGRHGFVTDDILNGNDWEKPRHNAAADAPMARIVPADALRPPDLIIQDELHLIAGPLGSLVGLYETAVDKLATWRDTETRRNVRPKVVASTATVRRAGQQIDALFYRRTEVFPPAGLDVEDSFFARARDIEDKPGRLYVGICAHGNRIRSTLIRVYVSVLGAAQKLHERHGRDSRTDPYMTLVGYFNSLRDLGSMRRLVEDDVSARLTRADERGLAKRYDPTQRELTSRLSSDEIRPLLDRLAVGFPRRREPNSPQPLDVLLATNMIAVGVDVSRLGMMVVANQPKSTAEYIQATSRVGRQFPGLVCTVYNWARPRDLSSYEHFEHFHANVYRRVEALSVTPFADRAVDRGLMGVLVSLVRELDPDYNGNLKAQDFDRNSQLADHVVRYLQRRSEAADDDPDARRRMETELEARLRYWARERSVEARQLGYAQPRHTAAVAGLLRRPGNGRWALPTCPTSLRDVEPAIPLLLRRTDGQAEAEPPFVAPVNPETLSTGTDGGDT